MPASSYRERGRLSWAGPADALRIAEVMQALRIRAGCSTSGGKRNMSKPLTDFPGKEGLVLTVTYPPSGADEIHRHARICLATGDDRVDDQFMISS